MATALESKIHNEPDQVEEKIQINRNAIEHRAVWMGLIFDELIKEGVDAEPILRRAIKRRGIMDGTAFKENCKDPEDLNNLRYDFFCSELGQKTFRHGEASSDRDKLSVDFTYCPLVSGWKKLGFDDERIALLCDIAMEGDRGIAEALGLTLDLDNTIAEGAKACEIRVHK